MEPNEFWQRLGKDSAEDSANASPTRYLVESIVGGRVSLTDIETGDVIGETARLAGLKLNMGDEVMVVEILGRGTKSPRASLLVLGALQRTAPTNQELEAPLIVPTPLTVGATKITTGVGRPVGVVTGDAGDLYIQTDGAGEKIFWFKASDTGSADWVPIGASSSFNEHSWRQLLVDPGAATVTQLGFAAAPTLNGTLSNGDDADGTMLIHTTTASTGNAQGLVTARTVAQRHWNPIFVARVKTQGSISTIRLWAGLADSSLSGSATPTARYAAFRYDSAADGTPAKWKCCTDSNTGSPTVTDSGVAVAINTSYLFRIEIDNDNTEVRFYIDNALVARHTTTIPSAATGLGIEIDVTTLQNSTRAIGWGRVALGQK